MGHSDGFAAPRVHPHRPAGRNVHLAAFASASLRLGTEGKRMVPNARRRARAFPTKRAHPDEDRSDRPPGAPFTFHERDPQRGDAAKPLDCPVSLDRGAFQRAPGRLASSASGVTRRRPRRFCHWYCNLMAKPMLTFLAGPRRPLAETPQDVFETTRGGTHTQSRSASGFEGAFALPVTGGAGSLLPFPCSLQPSSPCGIAVAGGP